MGTVLFVQTKEKDKQALISFFEDLS